MMEEKVFKSRINAQIKEHKEAKREYARFSPAWHREDGAIEALNRLKITITST